MKKLKLKIQDLENPSILTHREIKNILGGNDGGSSSVITCTFYYQTYTTSSSDYLNWAEAALTDFACLEDPLCLSVNCVEEF